MTDTAGFLGFARHALSSTGRALAPHHELLIARLQTVLDGTCDRLMVQMPPGSAKSTFGSILFPAYFLSCHKNSQIIATAHTASLSDYFGGRVRGTVEESGAWLDLEINSKSRASARFMTAQGGEYFSAGVRGPITGRRADLIIIDDPIKSWAEAESQTARDALHDWYRAELSARLKPGGRIVLLMTRWHEDDLAGRLLAAEQGWKCLKLPAIAEEGDAMGRVPGAALWPENQDEAAIMRRRQEVGERAFAALYQQSPRPAEACLFKAENVAITGERPTVLRSVRAWDLASSLPSAGRNPDYTVGLKLGMTPENRLIVLDVIRFQGSAAQVESRITETAMRDGPATVVALPQDPGQAGAAQISVLSRQLIGFNIISSTEHGAKVNRAMPAATQVDAGNLSLLAGPWNENFMAELKAFPDSGKDDQVDALSRAVNTMLTTGGQTARRMNIAMIAR